MKPYEIAIPEDSLIAQEDMLIDYQDAFGILVAQDKALPLPDIVKLFFDSFPVWVKFLFGIREGIAKLIGLKTAAGLDVAKQLKEFKGQAGEAIALFKVKASNETEILTGESDKHLDFFLAFIGRPKAESFEIILATTVHFNAFLGRLYFLPVKPIHRLLVPAILKRMARKLERIEHHRTSFSS